MLYIPLNVTYHSCEGKLRLILYKAFQVGRQDMLLCGHVSYCILYL